MADIKWLIQRFKAMSVPEVSWRLAQKAIQKSEKKRFKAKSVAVVETLYNKRYSNLNANTRNLKLAFDNNDYGLSRNIQLLGGYSYEKYRKSWHAGFQTNNNWPKIFSYNLEYKQRDEIGDARTNWELNRHFQFALLAKNYYASNDIKYLNEFLDLFEDWNESNPFLYGISWTSVMEVAIRVSNWSYALAFLNESSNVPDTLCDKLKVGIINMTDYVVRHYSRYSSANNHLIVEAYVIGQSGILFDYKPWIELSISILSREFPLQNYVDGVNKELSLHYQSFYMEAVGLMMRLLKKNNYAFPEEWYNWLSKMSRYMSDCIGKYGEVIEFGDSDEGKILDLAGEYFSHYNYVLDMMSCLLEERYTDLLNSCENIKWLFSKKEINEAANKALYRKQKVGHYEIGGNTILRSEDEKVLIGIDHAELGFGSIAAHGHADALSFQLYAEGIPVFVDPGTYIYHCDIQSRNTFRETVNHNTVCVDDKNQSEMKGAFLWGRRATCTVESVNVEKGFKMTVSHDGYLPHIHKRIYDYDGKNVLWIKDVCSAKNKKTVFVIAPESRIEVRDNIVQITSNEKNISINAECKEKISINIEPCIVSREYGKAMASSKIVYEWSVGEIDFKIAIY